MQKTATQINDVRNRLHYGLFEADKTCLYNCLIALMIHEGWKCHSFLVDNELVKKLIPRMALDNFDWHEVTSIQDIKGNNELFLGKVKTYIRNLKRDSLALDAEVGHAIAAKR